jgi:hypothetical protein
VIMYVKKAAFSLDSFTHSLLAYFAFLESKQVLVQGMQSRQISCLVGYICLLDQTFEISRHRNGIPSSFKSAIYRNYTL